jgi:hypothetical protein
MCDKPQLMMRRTAVTRRDQPVQTAIRLEVRSLLPKPIDRPEGKSHRHEIKPNLKRTGSGGLNLLFRHVFSLDLMLHVYE